jgi:hypothetical protein
LFHYPTGSCGQWSLNKMIKLPNCHINNFKTQNHSSTPSTIGTHEHYSMHNNHAKIMQHAYNLN